MYGLVEYCDPRLKLWVSPCFICWYRPGSAPTGGNASNSMLAAAVLVCSCCWIAGSLPVSVTLISLTYALRTGSVLAFHAGLRT